MFLENQNCKVFLYLERTDMRKAVNGLSQIVKDVIKKNPLTGNLFVFCNKNRTRIKILYWDTNGFCLWYKRLENDKFMWPKTKEQAICIKPEELNWLLRGLDFRKAHKTLQYTEI